MNPFFVTDFSISDSLKTVRKSVLIYETIILTQVEEDISLTRNGEEGRLVQLKNEVKFEMFGDAEVANCENNIARRDALTNDLVSYLKNNFRILKERTFSSN